MNLWDEDPDRKAAAITVFNFWKQTERDLNRERLCTDFRRNGLTSITRHYWLDGELETVEEGRYEEVHACTEWNGNGYCLECGEHYRGD